MKFKGQYQQAEIYVAIECRPIQERNTCMQNACWGRENKSFVEKKYSYPFTHSFIHSFNQPRSVEQ